MHTTYTDNQSIEEIYDVMCDELLLLNEDEDNLDRIRFLIMSELGI